MMGALRGVAGAAAGLDASLECHGVVIPLDRPDAAEIVTPVIYDAIASGRYEAREAAFLPEIVEPGDRVLEIGAGIGVISTLVSRCPGVEHIIAVEANPRLIPFIRAVHQANGVAGAEVHNVVLGNGAQGRVPFYLRRDFWMSSMAPGPEPYVECIEVPTADFSELLRSERISLIICDIEGAEAALFGGADLSQVDRVYMELHDHITGIAGIARVFGDLAAQGLAYDPRGSSGQIVLFRRLRPDEPPRAYCG